ncbi:hypothetical protein CUJ90_30925 [Paraburkholderia terricola]|nr:hypothetical protein CUJ90_30925 [Paraburkholderia terricola]
MTGKHAMRSGYQECETARRHGWPHVGVGVDVGVSAMGRAHRPRRVRHDDLARNVKRDGSTGRQRRVRHDGLARNVKRVTGMRNCAAYRQRDLSAAPAATAAPR